MLEPVLDAYGFEPNRCDIKPFGSGLINNTWTLEYNHELYILQRINEQVFKNPMAIAENIEAISAYLKKNNPSYYFVQPVRTKGGESFFHHAQLGHFRLFPYVEGSVTVDVVNDPAEAFEAAAQFGDFTKALQGFNVQELNITIPGFHDLEFRYKQFIRSLESPSAKRKERANNLVEYLKSQSTIAEEFKRMKVDPEFKVRVTHHDTKISNVLFNEKKEGICVIDLDTVMPGYFISDVGDMMRTYLSPVSEEEPDASKIEIRDEYFAAIAKGYLSAMKDELTDTEKKHFLYAGKFMIYMQALRFITDYLNNDIYYGQKYEGHNLVRAQNQAVLLQKLIAKEDALLESIKDTK